MMKIDWALAIAVTVALLGAGCSQQSEQPEPSEQPEQPKLEYPGTERRFDLKVNHLALSSGRKPVLYAALDPGGVYKKQLPDGKWLWAYAGIKTPRALTVAAAPHDPKTVFVGTNSDGLYKSTDQARTWRQVSQGLTSMTIEDIAFDPNDENVMYVTTRRGGVFRSTDFGETWQNFGEGIEIVSSLKPFRANILNQLAILDNELFLATTYGLYRRGPADSQWELLTEPAGAFPTVTSDPRVGRLYAIAYETLYRFDIKTRTWEKGSSLHGLVTSITPASDPNILYASMGASGIKRSADAGNTWESADRGVYGRNVNYVIRNPDGDFWYAGLYGFGVYGLDTDSDQWHSMNVDFPVPLYFDVERHQDLDWPPGEKPPVPPEVAHTCNLCHGWTDPYLNYGNSGWYVTGTPRDWRYTVTRMNAHLNEITPEHNPKFEGDVLTPAGEDRVIEFMTHYFGGLDANKR